MKKLSFLSAFLLISACGIGGSFDNRQTLLAALNKEPDGFSSFDTSSGQRFKIISTSANQTKLCRVVSIEQGNRFIVETFCKAKGGKWR